MLQNTSRVPESRLLSIVRSSTSRPDRPSDEALKLRNRWPFTVATSSEAHPLADSRRHGLEDDGGFVT